MSSPLLRPAELKDLAAITRIYAHAVLHGTASFETEPPDEVEMTRRQRALIAGGYPYLVAEGQSDSMRAQSDILGYAYAGAYRARPGYRFTVEDSIYVAPRAQRRGVGRALLARLIADTEARGF